MPAPRGLTIACVLSLSATLLASPPPGVDRRPEFVQRVNAAIERGVAWLKKQQTTTGAFADEGGYEGGTGAIAYHTLRVCGVPREDPAAVKAWDALRRDYVRAKLKTYSAALYLMAVWSHGDPIPKSKDDRDVKLTTADQRWAEEIARSIVSGQNAKGAWSYMVGGDYGVGPSEVYDHSNTQYALLGLKAAARCGIAVDPVVWRKSLVHFLAEQETSGPEVRRGTGPLGKGATAAGMLDHARGWDYGGRAPERRRPYPSMTAGGVSSVVICRSELLGTKEMTTKLDADSERSAWDGLAWLGTNWLPRPADAPMIPRGKGEAVRRFHRNMHWCYELYGVERAGVLAGVDWMGELDWYGEGAEALLDAQEKDGSWFSAPGAAAGGPSPRRLTDTCFALLFLKRGTSPVRRGAVTAAFDDTDINFAAAAGLRDKDFEDFVDLVLSRWRKATDDGVKGRIFDGAVSVGARIVEPLLVRMDAPTPEERTAASALLIRATGRDFGYRPDAPDAERGEAVLKWQTWWIGAKAKIGYDVDSKRLVVF